MISNTPEPQYKTWSCVQTFQLFKKNQQPQQTTQKDQVKRPL